MSKIKYAYQVRIAMGFLSYKILGTYTTKSEAISIRDKIRKKVKSPSDVLIERIKL